ncbi:hypothetical protein KV557_22005 [Kitasatospora aureofaciens]|uniref:hypothetical protein n=1 Tax=Kitasatospora aureofaciens TaxID=1894 RepID=UPI001C495EA6|nr:hypothetical protein [Kitasatospora aureofaciens]MBV6699740.1 hypothetical protein [Kitasatospora aureofaciens]
MRTSRRFVGPALAACLSVAGAVAAAPAPPAALRPLPVPEVLPAGWLGQDFNDAVRELQVFHG